ncbi:hypothetical protein WCLP8_3860001 [uncultured Gammaproteobacteria bacterium]
MLGRGYQIEKFEINTLIVRRRILPRVVKFGSIMGLSPGRFGGQWLVGQALGQVKNTEGQSVVVGEQLQVGAVAAVKGHAAPDRRNGDDLLFLNDDPAGLPAGQDHRDFMFCLRLRGGGVGAKRQQRRQDQRELAHGAALSPRNWIRKLATASAGGTNGAASSTWRHRATGGMPCAAATCSRIRQSPFSSLITTRRPEVVTNSCNLGSSTPGWSRQASAAWTRAGRAAVMETSGFGLLVVDSTESHPAAPALAVHRPKAGRSP